MRNKMLLVIMTTLLMAGVAASQGPSVEIQSHLINTDPFPLQSGDDGDLYFKVVNKGDIEAENVTVQLQDYFPFTVKEDRKTTYQIGSMAPGVEYHISTEFLVDEAAPDGNSSYPVKVMFDLNGDRHATTRYIDVEVQSTDVQLNLANIQATPSELRPDTEGNEVAVDVINTGDETAENVVLDLDLPHGAEPSTSLSHHAALGNIEPGETKTATFRFDLNRSVAPGMMTFPGTLHYSSGGDGTDISKDADSSIDIEGAPLYQITSFNGTLTAGERSQVRATVKNVGTEESRATRLQFLDDADLPFSFESSNVFVGTLDPGETGTAVFSVKPENDAVAKQYLLDFEARGVHGTDVFVDTSTHSINVEGSRSSPVPGGLGTAGVLLVVGLLAVVGYRYRRRILKRMR